MTLTPDDTGECGQACELGAFQTSSWISRFESVCFPTRIVPLPHSAVEYLESDGISAQDLPSAVNILQLSRNCVVRKLSLMQ